MNLLIINHLPILFLTFFSFSGFGQVMISQYIETNSGSTPKGVEIFNYGSTDIVFSVGNNLEVFQGTNGGSCSALSGTNTTTGTIKAGEVWVIGTPDLTSYAASNGTDLSGTTTFNFGFNGDDALQLYLGGVLMDVFGTCGSDPGSSWTGGGVDTRNNNIQTKTGICTGTTSNWTDPSVRFENVANGSTMTGFGNAPSSCSSSTAPTGVTTGTAGSITATSAIVSGNNVTGDGGGAITERGVVYGTSANPTTADNKKVESGTTGSFNATLTGLNSSTTYYARAFATNSVGTTYGSDVSFTTNAPAGNTDSDIIENSSFSYTNNVAYSSFVNSGPLTTSNSLELTLFTIRDGGAGGDADALTTTLTNLDLSITNHANLNRIAIFDGSTNVAEVAAASSVSFSSLNLQAADNSTKDFSVRVIFQSTVTDNEQVGVTITAAIAQAGASLFGAADAGGASSSTSGDNNRIEVTATDLVFDQQPTNVNVGEVMSPSPTVKALDGNANLDLDFVSSISLSTTGTFDGGATISATPNNGEGTFSNLIFSAASSGSTITATAAGVNQDVSGTFDVIEITEGWQITAEDAMFVIDFDNTVNQVNQGQLAGNGISTSPTTGQLFASAWAIEGMSDGNAPFNTTKTSGDFARGQSSGQVTTGGLYSFEVDNQNHALGFQSTTSDFNPGSIILKVQNKTGNAITSILLSYMVYCNNDEGRSSSLSFSYSTDNINFTEINSIKYTSPETEDALLWKANFINTSISSMNIAPQQFLFLKWSSADIAGSGSRDELAIDDIALIANPVNYTNTLLGNHEQIVLNANVTLAGNTTINGNLKFEQGKIMLSQHNLTINGEITGANNQNYIVTNGQGTVKQSIPNTGSKTYPIGTENFYTPITINQNGINDTISVQVTDQVLEQGNSGNVQTQNVLDITWNIEEKTPGGSNVDLTIFWPADAELSGFDATACFFSHYRDGAWYPGQTQDVSATNPRSLTLTNVTSFSPFAVGSGSSPLPVKVTDFGFQKFEQTLRFSWLAYAETNVDYYKIIQSNSRKQLALQKANLKTSGTKKYNTDIDLRSISSGLIELWEVNSNGHETFLASTWFQTEEENLLLQTHPLGLEIHGQTQTEPLHIKIFSLTGALVLETEIITLPYTIQLPRKGCFMVQVYDGYQVKSFPIVW